MSLDDTHRELRRFKSDLAQFNDTLAGAVKTLQREHSGLSGIWRDKFRREYDKRWATFDKHMQQYLRKDAAKYAAFIDEKIGQLGRYLGGG